MDNQPPLHPAIVAMVSLAAGIAANHPAMGQCQLARLRQAGVPEHQIAAVIEIARHIRDEAAQQLDAAFAEAAAESEPAAPAAQGRPVSTAVKAVESACCTLTPGGQACC